MNIKDALSLKPVVVTAGEHSFTLRRPSVADLAQAVEESKKAEPHFTCWLIANHLVEDGKPIFDSPEEVLACDASLITFLATKLDEIYSEVPQVPASKS